MFRPVVALRIESGGSGFCNEKRALIIRIGFLGPLYDITINKEPFCLAASPEPVLE